MADTGARGLCLDERISYMYASLRFFEKDEHHVRRFCRENVLLLVFDGVLRFSENGVEQEVCGGEYYIQEQGKHQDGRLASDSPKYLYIHFHGDWSESGITLPRRGSFSRRSLLPLVEELDALSREEVSYIEKTAVFFRILSMLREKPERDSPAQKILEYLSAEYLSVSSLEDLCRVFHYSKNHIVNVFKSEFGQTPFEYINDQKIKRAMYLLETTSMSIDRIAQESGFHYYSHFYRLFLRKNGLSPLAWRTKQRIYPDLGER